MGTKRKLTVADVKYIRASEETDKEISKRYSIRAEYAKQVREGKSWAFVKQNWLPPKQITFGLFERCFHPCISARMHLPTARRVQPTDAVVNPAALRLRERGTAQRDR